MRGVMISMVALATGSCTPALLGASRTVNHGAVGTGAAMVLISEDNPVYRQTLTGFVASFRGEVRVFEGVNEQSASARSLRATIRADPPALILALGDAAARLCRDASTGVPVLFAVVVDPVGLGLLEAPDFFGVSMAIPAAASFVRFKAVARNLKHVLAFFQAQSTENLLRSAKEELHALGVELAMVKVDGVGEIVAEAQVRLEQYDSIWLTPDPVVINKGAFDHLRKMTVSNRKMLLGSVSEKFTEAGALMSVSADFRGMGSHAALLAYKALSRGMRPADIGMRPPVGGKLSVNLRTASDIGLQIPPEAMMMVGGIVR